ALSGSGAVETLSGGTATGTLVNGGSLRVLSGAVASNTSAVSAGAVDVSAGGLAVGTVIESGATETVRSGGTASGTTINSGAQEFVSSGGRDVSAIVSGGTQQVFGVASGAVLEGTGATQFVFAGGIASDTQV